MEGLVTDDTLKAHRAIIGRMLAQLREDLVIFCEIEAVGGPASVYGDGPLRFHPDVIDGVMELVAMVRDAEALVGRTPGPAWLDAVLDGKRAIERLPDAA